MSRERYALSAMSARFWLGRRGLVDEKSLGWVGEFYAFLLKTLKQLQIDSLLSVHVLRVVRIQYIIHGLKVQ